MIPFADSVPQMHISAIGRAKVLALPGSGGYSDYPPEHPAEMALLSKARDQRDLRVG